VRHGALAYRDCDTVKFLAQQTSDYTSRVTCDCNGEQIFISVPNEVHRQSRIQGSYRSEKTAKSRGICVVRESQERSEKNIIF